MRESSVIDLAGRPIIVTGGGSGLGQSMCLALARANALVVIAEINPTHISETMALAQQQGLQGRLCPAVTDVTDPAACETLASTTIERYGTVFGLINCAGRLYKFNIGALEETNLAKDVAGWKAVFDLNVHGAFFATRAVIPEMVKNRLGRIINITTSFGTMQRSGEMPYGASKAALEALTVAWAGELVHHGITVNALLPGGTTDTRLFSDKPGEGVRAPGNKLINPTVMGAPAVWLMSDLSQGYSGKRIIASRWNPENTPDAADAGGNAGWLVPEGQQGIEGLQTTASVRR